MTTHRSCPYCQETVAVNRGMYEGHLTLAHSVCPVSWRSVSLRTTLEATLWALYKILGGQ